MSDNSLAVNEAIETAERIEDMDNMDELDPLDVKIETSIHGGSPTVGDVTLVLTTGGPHVEYCPTRGTVSVSWGGDYHTTHVNNDALNDEVDRFYTRQFEDHYLADSSR